MNNQNSKRKIRVLIVDDSAVMRTLLSKILSSDSEIQIAGTAQDPYEAREKLVHLKPDVMTLDVEMPRMDGITFLDKVMKHFPVRTIVISSLTQTGAETALRALENGAVDVMAKPQIDLTRNLTSMRSELIQRIKAVASAKMPIRRKPYRHVAKANIPATETTALARTTHQVIAIASSTGGTEALKVILTQFPLDVPGTIIVQHMPATFTKTYADALQKICPFEVKEAQNGDRILPGRVLIAPGDYHIELIRSGAYYFVKLNQDPPIHGVRPAADVMLKSVAKVAGANAIGIVLTGMGKDGAEGLLEMKNAGSYNIAQDEASCVVFGMPKEAIHIGATHSVLPLKDIAAAVMHQLKKRNAA